MNCSSATALLIPICKFIVGYRTIVRYLIVLVGSRVLALYKITDAGARRIALHFTDGQLFRGVLKANKVPELSQVYFSQHLLVWFSNCKLTMKLYLDKRQPEWMNIGLSEIGPLTPKALPFAEIDGTFFFVLDGRRRMRIINI